MDREEYAAIAANQGIRALTESAELQRAAEVHPASCPQDRFLFSRKEWPVKSRYLK
ncbi:hypothetical protein [Planococcus lenghuensis]|uniref:hypothetical protein n=1 Tax=Planococcus lenghuensis TaxID=2213202 RepID=UPI0012ECAEB5|nr:hypothetical protein [Planococcus lenghuensis]